MTFPTTWSDERVAQLKHCFDAKLTCSQIARELGVTRNAVIGKLHRLGLSAPRPARAMRLPRAPKPKAAWGGMAPTVRAARIRERTVFDIPVTETITSALSPDDIPRYQRRTIATLGERHCRFPYGEPGKDDFFFCGGVRVESLPYCAGHCQVAFGGRRSSLENLKVA